MNVSIAAVAAYRDAFLLFLEFTQARLHKAPTVLRRNSIWPAFVIEAAPYGTAGPPASTKRVLVVQSAQYEFHSHERTRHP